MTVDLSEEQLDLLCVLIESGCSLTGPVAMEHRPILLQALPKLRKALDAYGHRTYVIMMRTPDGTRRMGGPERTYTKRDDAEKIAFYLNDRAVKAGKQTHLVVPQKWETRYWVQEIFE